MDTHSGAIKKEVQPINFIWRVNACVYNEFLLVNETKIRELERKSCQHLEQEGHATTVVLAIAAAGDEVPPLNLFFAMHVEVDT